jgi:hypothetical protein
MVVVFCLNEQRPRRWLLCALTFVLPGGRENDTAAVYRIPWRNPPTPVEPTMSDPSKKSSPPETSRTVDEEARLDQIKKLWSQLARLRTNSAEHRDLVRQIRKEADEFRKLTEKGPRED